jgi:hypothetical protein
MSNSQAPGTTGGQEFMGFQADTIVFNPNTEADLLNNTEFLSCSSARRTPTEHRQPPLPHPRPDPAVTWGVPDGEAWVMQSKVVGGYADEIPLEATELYYWQPRQILAVGHDPLDGRLHRPAARRGEDHGDLMALTLKLTASIYDQAQSDDREPGDVRYTRGDVFEARNQAEYDRLIARRRRGRPGQGPARHLRAHGCGHHDDADEDVHRRRC